MWLTRPRTVPHAILGRQRLWTSADKRLRVTRFLDEARGPYYACHWMATSYGGAWSVISKHRKLSAAKRACELFLNQ
jgi:hypothetical protein